MINRFVFLVWGMGVIAILAGTVLAAAQDCAGSTMTAAALLLVWLFPVYDLGRLWCDFDRVSLVMEGEGETEDDGDER